MQWTARKVNSIIVTTVICVMSSSLFAEEKKPQKEQAGIHLDQSKDVIFEQFSPSTFTLQLLQARSKFNPNDVIFGGSLEADLQRWVGDTINLTPPGVYQQGHGLYFTQATFDVANSITHWSTLFFSVADSHIGRPGSNGNYIYLPHAFVAFGDIDKLPFFTTIGINSIPFGIFTGSGSTDTPLTAAYFDPIQAPQVSVGFYKNGFNFSAAGYSDQVTHDNNFAYSFYYAKTIKDFNFSVGSGYLTDLKTTAAGNPTVVNTQKKIVKSTKGKSRDRIVKELGLAGSNMGAVVDINAHLGYKQFGLSGEYVQGNKTLDPNQHKPCAFAVSASYSAKIWEKTTSFGISYSRAFNFKNVPVSLPGANTILLTNAGLQREWAASVTRPVFNKNTVIGLGLQNTTTFFAHHTYTGTLDLTTYL